MKKVLLVTLSILAISFFPEFTVNAAESTPRTINLEQNNNVLPMSEQTQWVLRVTDEGQLQKRLWSITYGIWLTDWIDVE